VNTEQTAAARIARELPRLLELAVRHAAAGATEEGRKMVWALLRVAPEAAEGWHALAAILHRQANGTGAAIAVTRALQIDPAFSMAHALKADMLLCTGDVATATRHLDRAIARPERLSPDMHRWAASMHRRLSRPDTVN